MQKPAVLFLDFDGVIIESNDAKTRAFADVFSEFAHFEEMMKFHHDNVSVTRFAKFEHLASLVGPSDPEAFVHEVAERFSRRVAELIAAVPLVPGALRFLDATQAIPTYLASVTPEAELHAILESRNLKQRFRWAYGCPPWTKAGAIQDALKQEKVDGVRTLLIGDSAGDQRAADEAGVPFIGRDSGLPFDDPQPTTFPDLDAIADHFEEVLV